MAVLCVECQKGMLGPDAVLPGLADTGDLVQNLSRLLSAARGSGIRVVHATYEGTLGGKPTGKARLWRVLGPAIADWEPGATATKVIDELLAPGDLVLGRRHGLFPTLDTELLPVLRDLGVQTIVLVGISLNLALPHTAGHASQSGFEVVVPRDAVGGIPTEYGEQVLNNTIAALARLTTVDELIAEWSDSDACGASA